MKKCNSIDLFSEIIESKLDLKWARYNKAIFVLFAYNSTGKTIISSNFKASNTLCYNSFFEDLLLWDNEKVLNFNYDEFDTDILTFMNDQGLEEQIKDLFHEFIFDDIAVDINFQTGKIYFYKADDIDPVTGENYRKKIKISRAEETLFKFSIFYVLLDRALLDVEENKKDSIFYKYDFVTIDDPTSNLDDSNIIRIADKIAALYSGYEYKHKIKFLVETHNVLFLDVLKNNLIKNQLGKEKKYINFYKLNRLNSGYAYSNIKSVQIAYHIEIKEKLDSIMREEFVSKSAYNLFRILLEKQSTFIGLPSFSHCIRLSNESDKEHLIRFLNHYSHGNLTEMEFDYIDEYGSKILREAYYNFLTDYGWR